MDKDSACHLVRTEVMSFGGIMDVEHVLCERFP